jgi:hypothetical protein
MHGGFEFVPLHEERYVFVGERKLIERLPLAHPNDARRHTLLDAQADLPLFRYFRDARSARGLVVRARSTSRRYRGGAGASA